MEIIFYIMMFIFGAIIGSFLNVVILRLGTGRGLGGRSSCGTCAKTLHWYELVPVVSYLVLRGRCSRCLARISSQYALVETLTGLVFVILAYLLWPNPLSLIFALLVASILIVITVYDLKHMIIPDKLVFTLIGLGIIYKLYELYQYGYTTNWVLDVSAGMIFFSFFGTLWLISKGTWLGFGDAKLVLALGLFLGLSSGFVALLLAFWIGAIVGVALLMLSKSRFIRQNFIMKSEIPFGPFIILGLALVFFFRLDFMWVSSLFTFL